MNRRSFLGTVGAAAVGVLAGCPTGSASSGDYDVGMSARKFRPASIEVPPGTTVVWQNTSKQGHTVTAYEGTLPDGAEFWASGGFDSQAAAENGWTSGANGNLTQNQTFEHTFEVVGTHEYYCIPHEAAGMRGEVVVSEDATTATEG
jgi:plastocyanin